MYCLDIYKPIASECIAAIIGLKGVIGKPFLTGAKVLWLTIEIQGSASALEPTVGLRVKGILAHSARWL